MYSVVDIINFVELNELVQNLEEREKQQGSRAGQFRRKERVLSTPAQSTPPDNAPQWTIAPTESTSPILQSTADAESTPLSRVTVSNGAGANVRRRFTLNQDLLDEFHDNL